jgi:pantoate--beta-alanine ligase
VTIGSPIPPIITKPTDLGRPAGSRGFVATMGALHAGHQSLISRARAENDEVIVSIFVNPTQFNDPRDLERYPRDLQRDAELATAAGATTIYAPTVDAIYPRGFASRVHVEGMTNRWEGASRSGHFDGVATVVTILLNQIRPDRSYFGEKDFQQVTMLRRVHRDLALPGEIVTGATVREADGLALSSRNARLSPAERESARLLSHTLFALRDLVTDDVTDVATLLEAGNEFLTPAHGIAPLALDYLAIVDPESLEPVTSIADGSRALIAATVGNTRLIDTLDLRHDGVEEPVQQS